MVMKRSLIALVVVLLLVLHLANQAYSARIAKHKKDRKVTCFEEPKKCIRAYEIINERLDSYDIKENMEDINSWITTMLERVDAKKEQLNGEDYDYLMALYRIQGLRQLESVGICKTTTVTLLHDSDVALKNVLAKREPFERLKDNRLVFMLKKYLDKYLSKCDCGPRLAKFDILLRRSRRGARVSGKLERLKAVISELIGSNAQMSLLGFNFFEPSQEDILTYVDRNPIAASSFAERYMNNLGSRPEDVKIIRKHLIAWAKEDKIEPPKEGREFSKLFHHYVIRACRMYYLRLESLFSGKWIRAQAFKYYRENYMEPLQLYKYEAYYHGCEKVRYAEGKLTHELEKVDAEEESKQKFR